MSFHLECFYTPVKIYFPHHMGGKQVRRRVPNANWTCTLWPGFWCALLPPPSSTSRQSIISKSFPKSFSFCAKHFTNILFHQWLASPPFFYSHIQAQISVGWYYFSFLRVRLPFFKIHLPPWGLPTLWEEHKDSSDPSAKLCFLLFPCFSAKGIVGQLLTWKEMAYISGW